MRSTKSSFKSSVFTGAFALALFAVATPASAQGRVYAIEPTSLSKALREYGRVSGRQLIFKEDLVRGKRSSGLNGSYSSEAALAKLLNGSGLKATTAAGGALMIESIAPGEAAAGNAPAETESVDDERGTPEILVVGRKTMNVDIRRTRDDPQPYVVFDSEEIKKSNATNLEDFFRSRLPQNTQAQALSQSTNDQNAGPISQVNLRGLGVNQTLILVDGRRAPRLIPNGFEFSQADINGIPLSAIERIEVLPSSAGGIYGGGAVGGVINIIRKRDYKGVDVRLGYDGTFRGGGETFRAEISGGFSPNHGKTQVTFSGSYSSSQPLYVGDADDALWRPARALFAANNISNRAITGYTPNIISTNGANLVFDDPDGPGPLVGTPLNSNHTFVPVGYAGLATDNGAALVANAGQYNIDLPNDVTGTRATLRNNPRVISGNVNVRHQFSDALEAFADFSISDNLGRSQYGGGAPVLTLAAAAPGNPFQQPIRVYLPAVGLPTLSQRFEVKDIALAGGLIARLGHHWVANADYSWSHTNTKRFFADLTTPNAFRTAATNGTVNIFSDVNQFPIDYSAYQTAPLSLDYSIPTTLQNGSVRFSGPLFDVGGGSLTLTMLGEHRFEEVEAFRVPGSDGFASDFPRQTQKVESLYAEVTAPLVSERNRRPLLWSLDLNAAVRHDWYRTRGAVSVGVAPDDPPTEFDPFTNKTGSTDYTLAGRWAPIQDLAFRASYATGFLPPSVSQVTPFLDQSFGGSPDPLRGGEPTGTFGPYDALLAGNPNLSPETSTSLSLGIIFTPSFLSGFRFSADYSKIHKRNEINQPDEAFILANEDRLPGRVVRGPTLPGDPVGFAGPVIFIDTSFLNISQAWIEAWDFTADYTLKTARTGEFHLYAAATLQTVLRRQSFPDTERYNTAGFFDGPLKWRGNMGIDWTFGHWTVDWNAQYYDSYSLRSGNPLLASAGNTRVINQGGVERIPSQTYHDLGVRYRFGENSSRVLAGLDLAFGVQNIFDKKPPPIAAGAFSPVSGYSPYGDARLRRFTLSLNKHFGQ